MKIALKLVRYLFAAFYLLIGIQTALGMVLLAPFVVVIFFTHLMLAGSAIWGTAHLGLLTLFAWQFRSAFRPLWSYPVIQPRKQQASWTRK